MRAPWRRAILITVLLWFTDDLGVAGQVLSGEDVVELAARAFGRAAAPKVAIVVWCESRNDAQADTNRPYVGLAQIDPGLHHALVEWVVGSALSPAEARAALRDPRVNLYVAASIRKVYGWAPWPVCGR